MSTLTLGAAVRQPARTSKPVRPNQPLKLTRRGVALVRTLIVASFLVIALAVTSAFGSATASDQPGVPVKTVTYVVMPGETLWTIARDFNTGNPGALIDQIKETNGLHSSAVKAGQRIQIPVR